MCCFFPFQLQFENQIPEGVPTQQRRRSDGCFPFATRPSSGASGLSDVLVAAGTDQVVRAEAVIPPTCRVGVSQVSARDRERPCILKKKKNNEWGNLPTELGKKTKKHLGVPLEVGFRKLRRLASMSCDMCPGSALLAP